MQHKLKKLKKDEIKEINDWFKKMDDLVAEKKKNTLQKNGKSSSGK